MWSILNAIFNRRSAPPTLYSSTGEIINTQSGKLGDVLRAFVESLPPNAKHFQILTGAVRFFIFQSGRRKLISAGVLLMILLGYPAITFVKELAHKVPERGAEIVTDKILPAPAKPDKPKETAEEKEPPEEEPSAVPPAVVPVIWYESLVTLRPDRIVQCELKFKAREAATRGIRFYISTPKGAIWLSPYEIVNGWDEQDGMKIKVKRVHDNLDRWTVGYMAKDQVLDIKYTVKFRGTAPIKLPKIVPTDPTKRIALKPLTPESGSWLQFPDHGERAAEVLAAARHVDLPAVPELKVGQMFPERYAVSASESARFRNCMSAVSFSPVESGEQIMLVSGQEPDGCTYDPAVGTIKTIASDGSLAAYTYDAAGNLLSIAEASGATVTYSYDSTGRLARVSDMRGRTATIDYDDDKTLIAVTGPHGEVARYAYDGSSRLTAITDPIGAETKYAYDTVGNLISVTDALGRTTNFEYDSNGNPRAVTDSNVGKVQYTYDVLNRLTAVSSPTGITQYTYDAVGNRTSMVDPNGATTTYSYDDLNRLAKISNAQGNAVRYTYDNAGNLLSRTDVSGNTTSFTYDYSAGSVPAPSITSLNPAAVTAGGTFTVMVTGSGFVSGAVVNWNGTALPTGFVSGDQLTAVLPASLTAYPGTASLTVTSGGMTSNPSSLAVIGLASQSKLLDTQVFQYDAAGNLVSIDSRLPAYVFNPEAGLGTASNYAYDSAGNRTLRFVGDFNGDGLADSRDFGASILRTSASGAYAYDSLARLVRPSVYGFAPTSAQIYSAPVSYGPSSTLQPGMSSLTGNSPGQTAAFAINDSGQIVGTISVTFSAQAGAPRMASLVVSSPPTENNADIWATITGTVATGSLSAPIWVQVRAANPSTWWIPNQSIVVTGSEIGPSASGVWMIANADPSLVSSSLGGLGQGTLAWTVISSGSGSGFWLVPLSSKTEMPESSSYLSERYYDPSLGRFISTDPTGPGETTTDQSYGAEGAFPLTVQIADDGGTHLQVSGSIIRSTPEQKSPGSSSSKSSQGPLIVTFADPGGTKVSVSGTLQELPTQGSAEHPSTRRKVPPIQQAKHPQPRN